jgi:hypothetical protein
VKNALWSAVNERKIVINQLDLCLTRKETTCISLSIAGPDILRFGTAERLTYMSFCSRRDYRALLALISKAIVRAAMFRVPAMAFLFSLSAL